MRRLNPLTRKAPANSSTVTPGQILISRVWKACGFCWAGLTTGVRQGAKPGAPHARRMWVSFTSVVAGSSIGRPWLAAMLVKWLRMSTRISQSAINPVLDVSSTKVPFAQSARFRGAMPLSSSTMVMSNPAGWTEKPARAAATRN